MEPEAWDLDTQLRLDALKQAVQFVRKSDGSGHAYARHVVSDAEEFYQFLKGEKKDGY